jgi:hypothetical protein
MKFIFIDEYNMINRNLQITNKKLLFPNRICIDAAIMIKNRASLSSSIKKYFNI